MAKYEKQRRQGWVFYHENSAVLEAMTAEECKAVILALNQYSRDLSEGEAALDVSEIPSALGKAFCKMIAERVKQDADAYERKCSQNSANRRKRPSTDNYDGKRPSTDNYDGRQIKQNKTQSKEAEVNHENDASAAIIGFDGEDLTADMENCSRADELVQRYKLPDTDQSREALLEDAERVGFDRLEGVLKQAALSNNRQGLSVNFYRSVLNSDEKRKGASSFESTYGQM